MARAQFKTLTKTISKAGTAERLSDSNIQVWAFSIRAKRANINDVYIGDNTVSNASPGMEPGMVVSHNVQIGDALLSLKDIL